MACKERRQWLGGLERSCRPDLETRIIPAPPIPGIDRIEASFSGNFFEPHSHDTYAIGVTLHGVQTFRYRGTRHFSRPGQIIVLHPDEIHDGAAATNDGLRYRMLYLEPSLVRMAMGDLTASLPFVGLPVIEDELLRATLISALETLDCDLEDIQASEIVGDVTDGLLRHSERRPSHRQKSSGLGVWRAREFLLENCRRNISSLELEQVSGLDQFSLARQFRTAFGTSPHRFLIMRRLDCARRLMTQGAPLAETAATVGFADQSHLSRHFKRAFGVTPGKWVEAARA
ncbi:MAG: AraC family transcriptional regulator [Rhizobiales bacterium]|nr:AraC family transcriptional regulator [Hyphomicrobiales bacterium]